MSVANMLRRQVKALEWGRVKQFNQVTETVSG